MDSAERYLSPIIRGDAESKMIILSGPRQAGKTTLCRQLSQSHEYLNFDIDRHRKIIRERSWNREQQYLILDELHKMPKWKGWLKGLADDEEESQRMVVTGSARLETFKKTGDSLAGRFFQYRLHPFDLKEICNFDHKSAREAILERMLTCGNFPEPYLKGSRAFYNKWRTTHLDIILRQDLLDLENVRDIKGIELLIDLLRERVGSPLSANSLARDLQKDHKTIQHWLQILENLYVIFIVRPYHRNVARAILKEPKIYFFDTAQPEGDEGVCFENLVACALFKEVQYCTDALGIRLELHYVRTKDGKEVDFLITRDKHPWLLIEAKLSDDQISPNLSFFAKMLGTKHQLQINRSAEREKTLRGGFELRLAHDYLAKLDLSKPGP
jgi:predicted AAA+ superfamily ATPase